jgi:hypothetical protein
MNAIREKLTEVAQSQSDQASGSGDGLVGASVDHQTVEAAKSIAEELGFRFLETEIECDPADSRGPYVSMNVEAPQSMPDILEAHLEWHQRLDAVLGDDHSSIRLCVFPAPR